MLYDYSIRVVIFPHVSVEGTDASPHRQDRTVSVAQHLPVQKTDTPPSCLKHSTVLSEVIMRGRRGIVAAVATATLATTSSQAHQAAEQRSFAAGSTGSAMPHGCHSSHPLQAVATAAAGVACRKEEERGVLPPIVEDTLIVAGSDVQKQQQERRMGSERTNNGDADSRSSSGSKCPLLPRCDRRTGTTTATAAAHTISSNSPSMARRIPRSCPQRTTASTVSRHGSRLVAWGRASLGENQRHRPKSCAATLSPLFARGGGVGGGRWFTGVVRRDDVYDEFPDDFDYESAANDDDDTMDDDIDDDVLSWMAEEKRKWGSDGVGNDLDKRPPGAQEEVGDGGLKTKETERRGLRTEEAGVGSGQLDLPPASRYVFFDISFPLIIPSVCLPFVADQ